jgi:hypothetical protein
MTGRGSGSKVRFIPVLKLNEEVQPIHIKIDRVSGLTSEATKIWISNRVVPGSIFFSDGLTCFRATAE